MVLGHCPVQAPVVLARAWHHNSLTLLHNRIYMQLYQLVPRFPEGLSSDLLQLKIEIVSFPCLEAMAAVVSR